MKNLKDFIDSGCRTLLCVGPMSKNCVNASIEISDRFDIPIVLIASRRQIDSYEMGAGYVNNWTTSEFSKYIFSRAKKGNIILARDHGGPWQNDIEKKNKYSLNQAMNSAKKSFLEDIKSGFEILHIDPSIDIHNKPSTDQLLDRLFELYEFCFVESNKLKKNISFEIGTEEQSGGNNTKEELQYILEKITKFCTKKNFKLPSFVVVQTGTKVMETRNIGTFDSPLRVANEVPAEIQIPMMTEVCKKYNIMLKQHNTDYLSNEALKWHPRFGIHAANVAPEFGVEETKSFIEILKSYKLNSQLDKFLQLSFNSRKWEKWMLVNSNASDYDKAVIAGHYVFSLPEFKKIEQDVKTFLFKKSIDLNNLLKEKIKSSIMRYLINFRMIN